LSRAWKASLSALGCEKFAKYSTALRPSRSTRPKKNCSISVDSHAVVRAPPLQALLLPLDALRVDEGLRPEVEVAELLLADERKESALVPLGDVVVFLVFRHFGSLLLAEVCEPY
jgi:hypothetical protein